MSRIVRALEKRDAGNYINCSINPSDRRRVDVSLTDAGRDAYEKYRISRLGSMQDILVILPTDDRVHFMRIVRRIRESIAEYLGSR